MTGFLACLPTKGLFILNAKIPDGLFPEKCKQIYTSMNHKQIHLGTTKQYNRYNIMIISSIDIFSHQHIYQLFDESLMFFLSRNMSKY